MQAKRHQEPFQDLALVPSALLESSVIAVIAVSSRGEILDANETMLALLCASSISDLTATDFRGAVLSNPSDWSFWERAMTERLTKLEIHFRATSGREILLLGDIFPAVGTSGPMGHAIGVFIDITVSKQLQNALRRTAHMEAVGSLTSGIAHDFNNLLTVLVGNLYLVAEGVRADQSLFEKAKRARDAAKRGADLTRQLLSFSRSESPGSKTIDVGRLIENLEPLLGRAVGSKIVLETSLESENALIETNAAQLESVIVNLVINARDALDGAGTIHINVATAKLDAGGGAKCGVSPGKYVCVSVEDDGPGMPQAVREKVFEPFFSTKGDSEGTGLGLCMVRWFTEQAGGAVRLQSNPGQGTTVTLLLPRSESAAEDSTIKTMPLSTLPTGNENVLVMAGDGEIRSTIQQILEVLGYTVRLSNEPQTSFEIVQGVPIDLVLIDATATADLSIRHLVDMMRKSRPSIKVITLDDTSTNRSENVLRVPQLTKPFSLLELASIVRQTLDGMANE